MSNEEAKTMNTGSKFHECLCPLITKTTFSLDCADTNVHPFIKTDGLSDQKKHNCSFARLLYTQFIKATARALLQTTCKRYILPRDHDTKSPTNQKSANQKQKG